MLEFLVFLVVYALINRARRHPVRRLPPIRIIVEHYHHPVTGPGERYSMASNVVPFRHDAA